MVYCNTVSKYGEEWQVSINEQGERWWQFHLWQNSQTIREVNLSTIGEIDWNEAIVHMMTVALEMPPPVKEKSAEKSGYDWGDTEKHKNASN